MPLLLDAVLSDLSVSFDFFPFLPPKRPPNIPFFFFFVSPLSGAADVRIDFDFREDGVGAGSSTSWPILTSTFITCEVECGAVS